MTKLIALLMVVAVLWGGWELFFYWEKVENNQETEKKQAAALMGGEALPGMPYPLEASLQNAKKQGAAAMGAWLKTYGSVIQDPRKAWIQLDYCMMISLEDPSQAKRLFAEIKARTPHTSPVWPRIEQLQRTYE